MDDNGESGSAANPWVCASSDPTHDRDHLTVHQLTACLAWLCGQLEVEIVGGTRGDGVPGPFIDGRDGWEPIPDTFLPYLQAAVAHSGGGGS